MVQKSKTSTKASKKPKPKSPKDYPLRTKDTAGWPGDIPVFETIGTYNPTTGKVDRKKGK